MILNQKIVKQFDRRVLKKNQSWENSLIPSDRVFQNKLVVPKQRKIGKVNKLIKTAQKQLVPENLLPKTKITTSVNKADSENQQIRNTPRGIATNPSRT